MKLRFLKKAESLFITACGQRPRKVIHRIILAESLFILIMLAFSQHERGMNITCCVAHRLA